MGNCLAPHGGQKFRLGLERTEVAEPGMFSEAVVEDFDIVEDVGAQRSFIGENMVAHRGGFVAAVK